jgi:hypothetical protein
MGYEKMRMGAILCSSGRDVWKSPEKIEAGKWMGRAQKNRERPFKSRPYSTTMKTQYNFIFLAPEFLGRSEEQYWCLNEHLKLVLLRTITNIYKTTIQSKIFFPLNS